VSGQGIGRAPRFSDSFAFSLSLFSFLLLSSFIFLFFALFYNRVT
jgi:hypothetical protein